MSSWSIETKPDTASSTLSQRNHANNFDLLRLIAAMQVLYFHSIYWLQLPKLPYALNWLIAQFPGVLVFFLISGFLVTGSFIECDRRALPFFSRRVIRIYPGLFVNLAAIILLLMIGGSKISANVFAWLPISGILGSDYFGNLLVGVPFGWDGSFHQIPSGVLWTISVELGFYLLVPIALSNILSKKPTVQPFIIIIWAIVSLVLGYIMQYYQPEIDQPLFNILFCTPLSYFWIFLIGSAMRLYWPLLQKFVENRAILWVGMYIILLLVERLLTGETTFNFRVPRPWTLIRMTVLALSVVSCAYSAVSASSWMRRIDLSFGVYLYHMQVVSICVVAGFSGYANTWIIILIGTLIVATCSWFLVERPCLKRKYAFEASVEKGASQLRRLFRTRPPGAAERRFTGFASATLAIVSPVVAAICVFAIWSFAQAKVVEGVSSGSLLLSADPKTVVGTWATYGSATVQIESGAIRIMGDLTSYGNQWSSPPVARTQGGDYIVRYDIDVSNGRMGLGVVEAKPNGSWIRALPALKGGTGAFRFQTSEPFQIILFNNNQSPSKTTAVVKRLDVAPVVYTRARMS